MKKQRYEEPKKIKLGEEVHFKWMDNEHGGQSLGWAYFDVCQVWKYGKIKKIFIYPIQQHESKTFVYELPEDYKAEMIYFDSYTNNDSEAVVWYNGYCKEHKAIMSSVRVPKESGYFTLSLHFGNSINMDFHKDANDEKSETNGNRSKGWLGADFKEEIFDPIVKSKSEIKLDSPNMDVQRELDKSKESQIADELNKDYAKTKNNENGKD